MPNVRTFIATACWLALSGAASATITSSEITADNAQADGRRYVTERHVDHTGAVFTITYLAPAAANANTIMAARVAQIEAGAKANELAANLVNALSDDAPAPTMLYSTNNEFSAVLRERFKTATGRDALRLGWYVESFELTNNQLANLFGITAGQAATLQAKLDNMAADYESMQTQVGE